MTAANYLATMKKALFNILAALGILAAPVLAAIGAFAALVTECTIEVEKIEKS